MKTQTFSAFLLSCYLVSCGGDDDLFRNECIPSDLQNGIIAFYPFMNGSLQDESSNSHDLTNPTAANTTSDRFGNPSCAYYFDNSNASDTYFLTTINTNFLNNLSAFSVSVWYQPIDSSRSGGDFEVLVSRGEEGRCPDRHGEWSVGLYDCRRAVFGHDNSVWAQDVTNPFTSCEAEINALTGKWHHVVAIKDDDLYQIYFDGVLNETASGAASCSVNYMAQDMGDLFIGKLFKGKIDDIIIYNRSLSQQEVTSLFALEPCCQ